VLTHIAAHGDRVSVRFAAHHTNGVVEIYRRHTWSGTE
jgi:hypothetical protein